ncbi:TIGR03086 family metal-binding protein [Cellulomonas endophytica]|uniref:TIGR03086 family metal-binding protein n=1 Tax=Cellulomonas endophytica TaxID=2494735 RepID=UPI0013E93C96|nr:TIGR03086 family metal-binding protein [Cellulomonas endophytica]
MSHDTDDIPYFPATAPAALADAATARGLIRPVLDDLALLVAAVGPEDLGRPTPCHDWDVATLHDHVLGWVDFFGAAFADPARRGERPDPVAFRAAQDPRDPADVVRAAADRLDAALEGGVLDGQVVVSQSRMDGPAAFGMVLGEYVVHGWDLATALGRPWAPPPASAEQAHAFFGGMIAPEYRGGPDGFFGAEVPVPDDASALDRLLGFAGRDPHWSAAPRDAVV